LLCGWAESWMALIDCPECKRPISYKAEACPHCGLPRVYFVCGEGEVAPALAERSVEPSAVDYNTLRNMFSPLTRTTGHFNNVGYIASSTARRFYSSYSHYLDILKDPLVKQYIVCSRAYQGLPDTLPTRAQHVNCRSLYLALPILLVTS
jgi:predicted amidophosphoribosyltransferase